MQMIRRWVLRIALFLTVLGPLIFIAAALGAKFGIWDWRFGLGTLTREIGPKVLMATLASGVLGLIFSLIVKPRKGLATSALAIIVPVIGLGFAASVKGKAERLPLIHDITTDTQNPPEFSDEMLRRRAQTDQVNTTIYKGKKDLRENKLVSALQSQAYPDVSPLILSESPDVVFGEALAAAKALGWEIVTEDLAAGRVEATDTTFWYGFKDDIAIRIQPSGDGGSILDIRSTSRVGASDLGKNADRIRAFREIIQG